MKSNTHIILSLALAVVLCLGYGTISYFNDVKDSVKICLEDSTDDKQPSQQEIQSLHDLFVDEDSTTGLANIHLNMAKLYLHQRIALPLYWYSPLTPPPDLG